MSDLDLAGILTDVSFSTNTSTTANTVPVPNTIVLGSVGGLLDEPITVTVAVATDADGKAYLPVVAASGYTPPTGSRKVEVANKDYTTTLAFDNDLRVASQYDLAYATRDLLLSDITLLVITAEENLDQRILIQEDANYEGFWTIWRYNPSDPAADAHGLILEDIQNYRTSDFFSVVDWYAQGYSVDGPPVLTYPTISARDLAQGIAPTAGTFCQITDDGSGSWVWTVYDGTGWVAVARQNSTVQFSDAFYDASKSVYGVDTRNTADIANRDGSWELRALFNALKSNVLSTVEMNELFFSMVKFFHSQQDQVNWAFKTSFMNVINFNSPMNQPPVQTVDTTQNLLDYIDEVKPYHVVMRGFRQVYTPDIDQANVHTTDFDKPPFYDSRAGGYYRRLDPLNADDMAYMANTAPWSDWVGAYQKTDHDDPTSNNWNPVRSLRLKILFDRVDYSEESMYNSGGGWDVAPWDIVGFDGDDSNAETMGSALARIRAFYTPTPGMIRAEDVHELMDGVDFRGTITDASILFPVKDDRSEWDITPYDTVGEDIMLPRVIDNTIVGGGGNAVQVTMNDNSEFYGLRDPLHDRGHPEELVPVQANETLRFTVHTERTPGAPNHYVKQIQTRRQRRKSIEIPFQGYASSADAVMVFMGGLRADPSTYTVDYSQGVVTANLPTPRPAYTMVHAFGLAGLSRVDDFQGFRGDGQTAQFTLNRPLGQVEVIIDGQRQDPATFTVTGASVTLGQAPAEGAAVLIVSYAAEGFAPTHVNREVLAYNEAQQWTLVHRTLNPSPELEHAGTILDINGRRALPPHTIRGLCITQQFMDFTPVSDVTKVKVWADNVPYTTLFIADPAVFAAYDPNRATGIYFVGESLFINDDALVGKIITACLYDACDFTVIDGVLTVLKPLKPTDVVQTTTFENADLMGVETYSYDGNAEGSYIIPAHLEHTDFVLVSVNGLYLTTEVDFAISGWREVGWDVPKYDGTYTFWDANKDSYANLSVLTVPGGQRPTDHIVITLFRGAPIQEPSTWGMISAKPSLSMMGDPKLCSDWGYAPFDKYPCESVIPLRIKSSLGTRALYRLNESWEVFQWGTDDPANGEPTAVHLAEDLDAEATTISLLVPSDGSTDDVRLGTPDPEGKTPGVVMIAGERIEYYGLAYTSNTTVTLSELRRGTRATPASEEERRVAVYQGDGTTLVFALPGGTADVPEIRLTSPDGSVRRHLQWKTDFTFVNDATGLTATLKLAPAAGWTVTLGQSYPLLQGDPAAHPQIHPAGTVVRNVTAPIARPFHCPFRINDEPSDITLLPGQSYILDAMPDI